MVGDTGFEPVTSIVCKRHKFWSQFGHSWYQFTHAFNNFFARIWHEGKSVYDIFSALL